jgi:hypothetical protein
METDDWLAEMRSAWKAGIDRDEREQSAASARRLARSVAPDLERPRRQALRDVLPLAACLAACALGGIWLRQTMTAPPSSALHEIRADEAPAPAPAAPEPPIAPAEATPAASAAAPAASKRPAPVSSPARAKGDTDPLPPLPPPRPSNDRPEDDDKAHGSSHSHKMKRFPLKLHRPWLPPRLPRRAPRGHVRDL